MYSWKKSKMNVNRHLHTSTATTEEYSDKQFYNSLDQQNEEAKKIDYEKCASIPNDTKNIAIEEKLETFPQPIYGSSINELTCIPVGSMTTSFANDVESKYIESNYKDSSDNMNMSLNELTLKSFKENNYLKRPSIKHEEIERKKHKKDQSKIYRGKNETISSKLYIDEDKFKYSDFSMIDNSKDSLKVPPIKIVMPTINNSMSTRTNGKNNKSSYWPQKSPKKMNTTTITVEEEEPPQTKTLRSSNGYSSEASNYSSLPIISAPLVQSPKSTHLLLNTCSEHTKNVLAPSSGEKKQATIKSATLVSKYSTKSETVKKSGLYPRRCKSKPDQNNCNQISLEKNPSDATDEHYLFRNNYQQFLDIRKQIDNKRKNLFPVKPKPPSGFQDYLMNKRTYLLAGNSNNSQLMNMQMSPPDNLLKELKTLFIEQEKERQKLRIQHIVEKEKLVLSIEQEIHRVHGRAARELADQPLPFSTCTILMDEEVYNLKTSEQVEKETKKPDFNGRIFFSSLQDIDDKFDKIKECMILRHHHEADSLNAVQKMDWEWKLQELKLCTYSSKPDIDKQHVPIIYVSDDFVIYPDKISNDISLLK